MMKVLLVSPNVESLPDPVFPLGLAFIASALKRNRIPFDVLDLCFVRDFEAAIASAVADNQPDVIALSLRNVDNVSYPKYVSYVEFYRRTVHTFRKYSRACIVIGGSGFSLLPEAMLNHLGADYGVAGEGELSLVKLIDALGKKKVPITPSGPEIVSFGPGIVQDLNALGIPDRRGLDQAAYFRWGGMGNIQTKRGCPFECIYCTYPLIEGRKVRVRSPALICDEIEALLENGVDSLFVVDNEFNHPADHAQAVCSEIVKRKLSLKWSCYAHPRFVTPGLVESMLAAGCTGLEFGSDAANATMLAGMGKNFTVADLISASRVCRDSGMSFCHSLLLGGPGETMETVEQTLSAILAMDPTAVICMVGIRVFPGTRLAKIARDQGVTGPDTDFLKPVFYLSEAIEKKILPFVEEFSKQNPSWIFPGFNINIDVDLQKKLRRFGLKGPLWEHMKIGRRFAKV